MKFKHIFLWSQLEFTYTLSVGRPIKRQILSGVNPCLFIRLTCTSKEYLHTERGEEALKVKWGSMGILPILAEEQGKKQSMQILLG